MRVLRRHSVQARVAPPIANRLEIDGIRGIAVMLALLLRADFFQAFSKGHPVDGRDLGILKAADALVEGAFS